VTNQALLSSFVADGARLRSRHERAKSPARPTAAPDAQKAHVDDRVDEAHEEAQGHLDLTRQPRRVYDGKNVAGPLPAMSRSCAYCSWFAKRSHLSNSTGAAAG